MKDQTTTDDNLFKLTHYTIISPRTTIFGASDGLLVTNGNNGLEADDRGAFRVGLGSKVANSIFRTFFAVWSSNAIQDGATGTVIA